MRTPAGVFPGLGICFFLGTWLVGVSCGFADLEPPIEIHPPVPRRVILDKFRTALDRNIAATWSSGSLRSILNAVAREREIAILLDRRIDSERELPWKFTGRPLRVELAELADGHGASMSIVGNTVYIGPVDSTRKLRTLVHLREAELLERRESLPKGRELELVRAATVHWGDLARPADLIRQIASLYKLDVLGGEQVSHDLWAGCTLPASSVTEALSLVLIQFDLTFEWTSEDAGIQIVPVPEQVTLSRVYKPRNGSVETLVEKWRAEFPKMEITVEGKEIRVVGTLEEQEAIAELVRPQRSNGSNNGQPATKPVPLSRQTFTLKVERAPVRSILAELEKQGIEVILDESALKEAGIDIETRINLEVDKADAETFFKTICEPLKMQFQIEGHTVMLSPK